MIDIIISVPNISTVIQIYDRIRVYSSDSSTGTYEAITNLTPTYITLHSNTSNYTVTDADGLTTTWYSFQYYNSSDPNVESDWSDPIVGETGRIFYDPLFPPEVLYGESDQLVIDRIRRLIGDPVGIIREYGEDADSNIHFDNKTYELEERGWPCSVRMNNRAYNTSDNPVVDGYRFLRFDNDISSSVTVSGIEYGVDIWYYNFRHSDREIMEAYDTCPVPPGLTTTTATSEAYMVSTAIDLVMQENWEDAVEDGAKISDEGSKYDPTPGLDFREALLGKLQKRLDDIVKSLTLVGIEGVLID